MDKRSLYVLGGLVVMLAAMIYLPYKKDADIEAQIRNRIVQIDTLTDDGTYGCTGTMLSHNFILTNSHCLPRGGWFKIKIRRVNDPEFLDAVLISSATKNDFALLKFKGIDTSKPVEFTSDWTLGQEIILYGNPGMRSFVVGHSRIVGYGYTFSPMGKLRTMYIYPCNEGAPGFSGSGIYDKKGRYMGIHELGQELPFWTYIISWVKGEERVGPLCFAIPAKEVIDRNLDKPWFGFDMNDK